MEMEKFVRQLAKAYKYQIITFNGEQPFNAFENKSDYTNVQLLFVQYIKFYSAIYNDLYQEEVDEIVLSDTIYEDAYMYWRGKFKNKQDQENMIKRSTPKNNHVKETQTLNSFSWNFKKK